MGIENLAMIQNETFRIPVSLKFDKDDMFYNFIKPARDERSLTTIITNLLRAYYEDEEIRRMVDARNAGEDILKSLNEEIDRIALEHSRSVAQINTLKYETANTTSDFFARKRAEAQGSQPVQQQAPMLGTSDTMNNIMNILLQLTEKVENLEGKQNGTLTNEIQKIQSNIEDNSFIPDMPDFDSQLYAQPEKVIYNEGSPFEDDVNYNNLKEMGAVAEPSSIMDIMKNTNEQIGVQKAEAPSPVVEAPKSVVEAPKPTVEAPKSVVEAPKPTVEALKPVTENNTSNATVSSTVEAPKPVAENNTTVDSIIETPQQVSETESQSIMGTETSVFEDDDPVFEDDEPDDTVEEVITSKPAIPASFLKFSQSLTRTSASNK